MQSLPDRARTTRWSRILPVVTTCLLGALALSETGLADASAPTATITENYELQALRGDSHFAWEAEFFGPGLDDGSSVNAGGVRAMAVWDDGSGPALYVGGGFVTAGPHHVNRIARWDGSAWTPLTGPNGTGVEMLDGGGLASVKALAVFEGDLIVAGFFDRAGGEEIDNIARWNGSEWSPLGPGLTGSIGVETLLVFDGALIAGGPFTQAGEETVDRIARWDGDQWSAVGGGVSGAEFNQTPRVYALAEFQGELVAGGNFLAAGEVPVNRIARWNGSAWASVGSGVSDASNPSADLPSVRTLTAFGDDLIAGGNFTKAGDLDARLIARWDGTAWSPLGGGMDGSGNPTLSALTVYDGALIAGGIFTEADGATVNRVARWNGSEWSGLSGPAGTGTNGGISSFAVFDGALIAGSQGFSAAGGVIAHDIARWNGSEWSTLSGLAGTSVSGQVKATALFEGALIVGGSFAFAGGETVFNVARWDGQAWAPLSGPFGPGVLGLPGGGVTPTVNALAVFDGDLIAGGSFLDAGGVFVRHIARWDGTEWQPLGAEGAGIENASGPPAVNALAVVDGALILGGRFTQAGGIAVSNVARWDGSGWSTLGPSLNDSVDALIEFDGGLIAGGLFTAAGGQPVGRIARWDGSQWSALGSGLDDWVLALGLFEGDLIAAGGFTHAGGQPANRVARWDGTGWSPLGGGVDDRASALAVYDGALFVGGFFSQAGGGTATRIARWDGVEWSPLVGPAGEGMGGWFNPLVTALAAFDADGDGPDPEKLIAGGRFHLSGGVANWNLASYAPADAQSHLAVTPGHVAFGGVTVGNEAGPRLVTLSSLGNVPVQVSGIDAAAPPFSQADGSCPPPPFELAPTDSCTLSYGFAPTEVGAFEQAITITTAAEPAVLTLAGEGIAQTPPAILIDPGSFSVVLSTDSTLDESLTIENAGDQVLEWELSPGCDLPGSVGWLNIAPASGSVAGGAAESVTVSFDAGSLAQGVYEALPCVASNDPDNPLIELPVTLTVISTPPMLAVDPASLSATVEEGEAETQPLSLGNLGEQTLEWAVTDSGDTGEIPEFGTTVNALTVWDDGTGPALYAGGAITSELHGIGRWDGQRWTALDTGFSNGAVLALTVFDGALIAGGTFTQANGVTVAKVALWDGSTWSPLGSGIAGGTTIRVNALTVFDGELIAGGSFTEAGGVTVNGIARWNGSEWAPLGSGLTTQVFALTVFGGDLIAGGGFTQVGDQTFNRIAHWDGSEWSPLDSGFDSSVLALTTFDGALIAGGSFGTAGGAPASRLARWDGGQWSPLGAGVNTQVGALTVLDGGLIAGGLFSEAGGIPAANVAHWDGNEWSPLGAGTGGRVSAVTAFGTSLIAGGTFTTAGGSPANRIARWDGSEWSPVVTVFADCEPPTWLGVDPTAGTIPGGDTQQVTVTFDATELAAGDYEANLCLASNDLLQPLTVVPLSLTVEISAGDPVIDVDPESLSAVLGEGETEIQPLTIANLGDATLDWQVTDGPDIFAVEQISAGGGHTCAVDAAGVAYCWGSNGDGQLGVGDIDGRDVPTPIDTTDLDGPVATISTGSSHTCAATTAGSAYCWGRNSNGQLGVDDTNPRLTPTAVVAGEMGAVSEIANGWQHTCAVDSDGDAFCWGSNFFGQLGNGDLPIERHVPWPVDQEELGAVAHIAAYGGHTCAVNDQAAGFCWGYNDDGNLGDGTTEQRRSPTPIDASQLAAVDHFSLSPFHTCAVDTAGVPYCWGSSSFGQLGDGTTTQRLVPTPVVTSDLLAAAQISTGEAHTCAVSTTGEGYCWGLNGSWQLGDGTNEDRHVPTRIHDDELGAVGVLSAGGAHSCAITATGATYCWGSNDLGQLGDGTTESRPFPTPVASGGGGDCVLPEWLSVTPSGGSVPGGDEQLVDVTFDATGLELGDYAANLCIASNDPAQPLTLVPATLTVAGGGVPELAFDPTSLDFGDVAVGTTSPPQSTTLHNNGDGDAAELSFNDISGSGFDVDAGDCGASLPAGASCEVVITFTPPFEGPINPTLVAQTPGVSPALLQLSGNGVTASPPSIDVDPESLSASLMQGATETQSLTVANLGDEDLEWLVPDLSQFGANVNALTVWDDGNGPALYVGGNDNTEFKGIARWDGAEWSLLGAGMDDNVEALTVFDGALIAAGRFTEADGVPVNRVARWDGSQWSALGDGFGNTVFALTVFDGDLIAGGLFTDAEGQPADHIARWDGTSWSPLGTGLDDRVTELTVYDGALHAGGWFTEAGGVPASRLARWDGTQWSALGAGVDSLVHAMTVYDGKLIAGGRFEEAGGIPANRVASWDGSTWAALGTGIPGTVTEQVDMLTVFDGALIAGGRFLEAGGVDARNIARWDGTAWSALGPGLSGHVAAGTVFDGALIAGGQFNFAGELPTRGIARWDGTTWSALVTEPSDCDVPGWMLVDPTDGTIAGGGTQPVSVTFDATDLPLGEHQANLCLLTNDPDALLVMVPVELTVTAAPEADIAPESFAFALPQGGSADDVLNIGNVGAAPLEWSIGAVESDLVVFDDINFTVPATQFGGSVRWDTGETCDCQSVPFNFNMWRTNSDGNLAFFWPGQEGAGGGGVSLDGSTYAVLGPGATVGPHSDFIRFTATAATIDWRQATDVDGRLGFRFVNPDTQQVNYGHARITTTGLGGHPATVVSWVYDQAGNPIAVGGCTDPADIPWLTVDPLDGTTPPDGSVPVDVMVDTAGLEPGVHQEQFCVTTNDPQMPLAAIPVELTVLGDEPIVDVDPQAFELEVPQGGSGQEVLNVGNLGTADLEWSLDEAAGVQGGDTDVVADGGFEAGTPNPSWEEGSTNFGTPLCDTDCGVNGAHSGSWWAWFGGIPNAAEIGFVTQEVTLPAADSAELRFWLMIADAFVAGQLEVSLDGEVLFSVTDADAGDFPTYTEVVLDVTAFADGTAHELAFHGETQAGPGVTSFFVDDVSLMVGFAGACESPTEIPWLSATPSAGTTPPDGNVPVDVVVDATGLELGMHQAQLCLTSNDPQTPLVEIPLTLNVTDAGVAELTFDPASLDFGDVEVGTSSPPQIATLENTGDVDLSGIAFTLPGEGYTADTSACGADLAAGASCSVSVTFTPIAPGPAAAALEASSDQGASDALALSGNGVGAAKWFWQNPLPQGNPLHDVFLTDADHGTAVGAHGAIVRTTDGGLTWLAQESGTTAQLNGATFVDATHGHAVGAGGTILGTADGGVTWVRRTSGTPNDLHGIAFPDAENGIAVGTGGTILTTADGGETWTPRASGTASELRDVSFPDVVTGTAVGTSGTILRTTDGGATWAPQPSGTTNTLSAVAFTDATTGTAVGSGGRILRTTDGGATWVPQVSGVTSTLHEVAFADADYGWAVGFPSLILRTTDGGATWTPQPSGVINAIFGISALSADSATAVGPVGAILHTTDGGETWVNQLPGPTDTLVGVSFPDPLTGTAVGNAGTILRTTDAGSHWVRQESGTTTALREVFFTDTETGTAVGEEGLIVRTTDGGESWEAQASGTTQTLRGVHFTGPDTGAVVGLGGTILTTADGGATWIARASGTIQPLYAVSFADADHGMAVGEGGTVLKTTDGGVTWSPQSTGSTTNIYAGVSYVDPQTATVVGLNMFGTDSRIFRTSDGGSTWIEQEAGTSNPLNGVFFVDADRGTAVGGGGTILATLDGGETWVRDESRTTNILYSVHFTAADQGTAVGFGGTILRCCGAAGELSVAPDPLDFGEVPVGETGGPLSLTLTNTGTVDVTVSDLSGPEAPFAPAGGTCDAVPFTLTPAASCTLDFTFTPTAEGPAMSNMTIASDAPSGPHVATLQGIGTAEGAAELMFDPSGLDFGEVPVGETSPPQAATLENVGDTEATGLTFSPPGNGFDADTGACGETLPAGESCLVSITFTPIVPGPASATLEVTADLDAAASLSLSGEGVPSGVGFTAMALEVDPDELGSDGNEVFEPGELVEVAPAWRNDGTTPQGLSGDASDLIGPDGAKYTLVLEEADYGTLDPDQTASCLETGVCYQVSVDDPAVRPAPHWEATFDETLSDDTVKTWMLHFGDSFVDVSRANLFYPSIETLLHLGITGGCTDSEYCPTAHNTRDQMPVFVLRAVEGADYAPPACVEGAEVFHDVAAGNVFCPWIEELANRGVVSGCGGDNYCPNAPVTRAQMAIFLLRSLEGSDYEPPACTGQFVDVPCPSLFADWIEELFTRQITGGCSNQPLRYCPANPVNREQMAAFIGKAFALTLYGP